MKSQLNRELIEGLNDSNNQEFLKHIDDFVYDLVFSSLDDIALKSPFITPDKCVLLPVNEVVTGAVSQLSEYSYFLGVENPQIEFNSKKRKNFWKNVWREFRASWRIGRKKYKKNKKDTSFDVTIDKYKISDFRHDMVNKLSEFLSETSMIYEYTNHISLIGIDDFGTNVRVNIYVCSYDSKTRDFKLYNQNKNKFLTINFGKRLENIALKENSCGKMYSNMIRIFNALYSKAYDKVPNQILVESLIFNCPNILFDQNDTYKTFVNVANYICLTSPQSFLSICDASKTIFQDPIITKTDSQLDFGKIVNVLDRYKYWFCLLNNFLSFANPICIGGDKWKKFGWLWDLVQVWWLVHFCINIAQTQKNS